LVSSGGTRGMFFGIGYLATGLRSVPIPLALSGAVVTIARRPGWFANDQQNGDAHEDDYGKDQHMTVVGSDRKGSQANNSGVLRRMCAAMVAVSAETTHTHAPL
jgi:hypothetical protein